MKPTLLLILLLTATACQSSPDIPDGAVALEKSNAYRSTGEPSDEDPERSREPAAQEEGDEDDDPAPAAKAAPPKEMKATGPVATVNGQPITAAAFNEELGKITSSGQVPPHLLAQLDGARRREFKAQIVESMVMRRLVEQQLATQKFDISDAEIDAKLAEMQEELAFANKMGAGNYGTLEDLTRQMGLTEEQLRGSVRQSIELERLVRTKYAYTEASQEEARAYYEENKDTFTQPEQARARHILIRVPEGSDEQAWEDARARLVTVRARAVAKDGDFGALAREHSDDSNSDKGGDLGYFARGTMVPEFEEATFALKNGEVSKPVRTQFGWHLIKREDWRAAGTPEFALLETQIVRLLTAQRFQRSLRSFLEELRESSSIEMTLENIS